MSGRLYFSDGAVVELRRSAGEAAGTVSTGIGVNWFDHFGTAPVGDAGYPGYPLDEQVLPDWDDEPAWQSLFEAMNELEISWVRFGIPADVIYDDQHRFSTDSIHWNHLKRLDAWASERRVGIMLDPFTVPRALMQPPFKPLRSEWAHARPPQDVEAYARKFVVPLARHAVQTLGLKSVRQLNLINEPGHSTFLPNPSTGQSIWQAYLAMMRASRRALVEAGFCSVVAGDGAGRLELCGPDHTGDLTSPFSLLGEGMDELASLVDVLTLHSYLVRLDWVPPSDTSPNTVAMHTAIDRGYGPAADSARRLGRPAVMAEIGGFAYGTIMGWELSAQRYLSQLTQAALIVDCLDRGWSGFYRWCLVDPVTGLAANRHGLVHSDPLRKRYFIAPASRAVWPLLGNAIKPGMQIRRLDIQEPATPHRHVHAVELHDPKTQRSSLLVVNDHLIEPRLLRLTDSNGQAMPLHRARVATEFGLTEDYDGICNHPTPVMIEQRRQPGFAVPPLSVSILELPSPA